MNKIINFHDVRDSVWFEGIVMLLKSKYKMVSVFDLEDFFYNKTKLENSCHITIDDGDKTFYDVIYPVLKRHNIPATIFVSPEKSASNKNFWFQEIQGYDEQKMKIIISDYFNISLQILKSCPIEIVLKNFTIDDIWFVIEKYKTCYNIKSKESQNMNVDQLLEIDSYGLVTIGAHTINHPILANENEEKADIEIKTSFKRLSEILGHEIKYFAYPNGIPIVDFGEREINILNDNNCRLAFSTEPKNVTLKDNPQSVPRFGISYGNMYFVQAKLLLGEFWPKLKELKSKGEKKIRIELKSQFVG